MKKEEYEKELKKLYAEAIKTGQLSLALELLERLRNIR